MIQVRIIIIYERIINVINCAQQSASLIIQKRVGKK